MLRTRSCSRSASHGKPRRQRKPGPAGPFVPPRLRGLAWGRAGPRCPRSAPVLPADPPRGCSAPFRGAGTGAARRSRALLEAAGPVPVAAGTRGSLPPFCSERRSGRSIPERMPGMRRPVPRGSRARTGPGRAGRPRGFGAMAPRSGRELTEAKRIPGEPGRGGAPEAPGPVAAHPRGRGGPGGEGSVQTPLPPAAAPGGGGGARNGRGRGGLARPGLAGPAPAVPGPGAPSRKPRQRGEPGGPGPPL